MEFQELAVQEVSIRIQQSETGLEECKEVMVTTNLEDIVVWVEELVVVSEEVWAVVASAVAASVEEVSVAAWEAIHIAIL